MSVFDPTTGNSNIKDEEVTAGPVLTASIGEISEAVTVAEVTGFAPLTSTQLTTDNALSYAAE